MAKNKDDAILGRLEGLEEVQARHTREINRLHRIMDDRAKEIRAYHREFMHLRTQVVLIQALELEIKEIFRRKGIDLQSELAKNDDWRARIEGWNEGLPE